MNPNPNDINLNIVSNYFNILINIIDDLKQTKKISKENLVIKRIGDIIQKINSIVNENKKNTEMIINYIKNLEKKVDKLGEGNKNIIYKQEIKMRDRLYIGQVVDGVPEGIGVMYLDGGNVFKGEFKNGIYEGKGIYYFNNGDKYEGDFKDGKREGKGIDYYNAGPYKGDRYEGEYKNGLKEGKGIYYWNNGDREMGDFSKDKRIGLHVKLTKNKEIIETIY